MKVVIKKDGIDGVISYQLKDGRILFTVTFPNADIVEDVQQYCTAKRDFKIPESNKIDDFRVDNVSPLAGIVYFELALCELYINTGVWVEW